MVGTVDTPIPNPILSKYGIVQYKGVGSHYDGERGEVREYIVVREREHPNHPFVVHTMTLPERGKIAFHWGDYCEDQTEAENRFRART